MDEGRFGLKVWFRRRWCPYRERPEWVFEDKYEWLWVNAAIEPLTGSSFCLLLPRVDSVCLQIFADHFGAYVGGRKVGLVLDGSGSHTSGKVIWPETVAPLRLPSYSPELNPAEQLFRHLRARLSNRVFESLDELEAAIGDALQDFWEHPRTLRSLTGYPWWLQAAQAIEPLAS